MNNGLTSQEFGLFQKYIEEQCGIRILAEKSYLIESRLSKFLIQFGLDSFEELYQKLSQQQNPSLAEKIIDAITTNETSWFRDQTPWSVMENIWLPQCIALIRQGKREKFRIWSAACSTGQEPYSIAMCIDHYLQLHQINDITLQNFEIMATDISHTALKIAKMGKYDTLSIARGLPPVYRDRYFQQNGRIWLVDPRIQQSIRFQKFNLQQSFAVLGNFDLIFFRYVAIYFSDTFKREVVSKITAALQPGGLLFWGNSEVFLDYQKNYEAKICQNAYYYRVREEAL